jgi:Putative 2OG-Fe(II) oxygenase
MSAIVPLFSTPVYIGDIDVTEDDKKHCAALPKSEGAFPKFLISHNDRVLDDPVLAELKSRALQHLECYVSDVYQLEQHRFNFYINTSWVSDMEHETDVGSHKHGHSIFTGVIVLDSTVGNNLYLENHFTPILPSFFKFRYKELNQYNTPEWYFDLKPNQIYLFPSDLKHSAKCHLPSGKLSVLAFDTFIKGTIGKHSDELTFN